MNQLPNGNCAGTNGRYDELFFAYVPGTGKPIPQYSRAAIDAAKAICRDNCPIINECLQHALTNNEHGVWGGTDEKERAAIKRRATRKKANTPQACGDKAGTRAGARSHTNAGERQCTECRTAQASYERDYNERKRKATA